jgi:hypothetical protein
LLCPADEVAGRFAEVKTFCHARSLTAKAKV